jgi:UDP-2-acetamido-2,6-beta-L-arabino-hexul-4-ose reductase
VKVLVTGSNGFIGKNLLSRLRLRTDIELLPITRASTEAELDAAAMQAEFAFHLAGVNRPPEPAEFTTGNVDFTRRLCSALSKAHRRIPIVLSSSIQAGRDNAYGASKQRAEEIVSEYQKASGSPAYIYRLPNVFGKWCRPNYNSVVATFCHNVANGLPIVINDPAAPVSLVYVDDVVDAFLALLANGQTGVGSAQVQPVYQTTVGELARLIEEFMAGRTSLVSNRVGTGLTRALYATFVSYLPTRSFGYSVPKYADARGVFVEMLKTQDSGQFSYFTAHAGVTRGGHYHHTKTEKFLVISGRARFRFRHILSNETHEFVVSGDDPKIVDSVPGWAHDITNIGDTEMVVMLWANEIFDRGRPDTYSQPVQDA